MKLRRGQFRQDQLVLVDSAESFTDEREPPLTPGNFVRLNSGGPTLLVVEIDEGDVVTSWRDSSGVVREARFPRPCVHRVAPASA
jgi:uncharacterized protein YodC (DUF2158 family)